jgi:hypothetical protein
MAEEYLISETRLQLIRSKHNFVVILTFEPEKLYYRNFGLLILLSLVMSSHTVAFVLVFHAARSFYRPFHQVIARRQALKLLSGHNVFGSFSRSIDLLCSSDYACPTLNNDMSPDNFA